MNDLKKRLNDVADQLLPVSGTLMAVACEQDFEHTETCTCRLCRAFLATQDAMNKLESIVKELP